MKLIININEQDFNYANNGSNYPMDISTKNRILSAIRNGKPYEERPQGEWIDHSEDYGYVECPKCEHLTNCEGNIDELHYCWNCGARLGKGGTE